MTQRVWLAVVYPIGNGEVFGAGWDRDQLHWTREVAERECWEIAEELGLGDISWSAITAFCSIGRARKGDQLYGVTVRGVLWPAANAPLGSPVGDRVRDRGGSGW